MGLPRNIPSGDEGLASTPAPPSPAPRQAPRIRPAVAPSPTEDELREFQRWKQQKAAAERQQREAQERAAAAPQRPAQRRSAQTQASTRQKASVRRETQLQEQPVLEDKPLEYPSEEDGWGYDPKTGKRYRLLATTPKEAIAAYRRTRGAGFTLGEMQALVAVQEGFDIDDLNGTAETFMAHLRVPPSPEEREEILRKKAEIAQRQKAERDSLNQELNEKEGVLEEPESDPFSETPQKKRGLFGRKS